MNSFYLNRKTFSGKFLNFTKKNMSAGFYATRGSCVNKIANGQSVVVYEAPEWNEIHQHLSQKEYFSILPKNEASIQKSYDIWTECVMNTQFKAKYFSLLPFFVEDRQSVRSKKKFVLKMELYPESKYLKFTYAMISGNF